MKLRSREDLKLMRENNTRDMVYRYLKDITKQMDFDGLSLFTTMSIADNLNMSRTLVSQTLNELNGERLLVKIKSRPVYFFAREALEKRYGLRLTELEYLSVHEFVAYISSHRDGLRDFQKLIGCEGSLNDVVSRIQSALLYPDSLPVLLYGGRGSGKNYLVRLMYEFCVNRKLLKKNTGITIYKVPRYGKSLQHERELFGYYDSASRQKIKGMLEESDGGILYIRHVEYLDYSVQEKLADFITSGQLSRGREVLKLHVKLVLSDGDNPETNLSSGMLAALPVICRMPSWAERSEDERREFATAFFEEQEKQLAKRLFISCNLLHDLVKYDFPQNLDDLQNVIVSLCANAYAEQTGGELRICASHLPIPYLQGITVGNQSDSYIPTEEIRSASVAGRILEVYQELVRVYEKSLSEETFLKESRKIIRSYYDIMDFGDEAWDSRVLAYERIIGQLFEQTRRDKKLHIPLNCVRTISRVLLLEQGSNYAIRIWERENSRAVRNMEQQIREAMISESILTDAICRKISATLNRELSVINRLFLILNIGFFNQSSVPADAAGVILCHGYSTASSIADAANTLLEAHIFEAIDMPLDIQTEEIAARLNTFIRDNSYLNSLILLVDMGSLEQLYELLDNRMDIGMLNNVTTSLAIHVGELICRHTALEELLETASRESVCHHRLIRAANKERAILFASDTGLGVSGRMAQLFGSSLPRKIRLRMMEYDYRKLEQNREQDSVFERFEVVLLITSVGLKIPGIKTVSLEEIVSFENIGVLSEALAEYLDETEIEAFQRALLNNFSLQSVVEHLTILNAQRLLSGVSEAVDKLQSLMGVRFRSKTIIGINIHVCFLVERLVMKEAIESYSDLEAFEKEHGRFISMIQEAFYRLTREYNVELPLVEIAYLYQYIANDTKEEEI